MSMTRVGRWAAIVGVVTVAGCGDRPAPQQAQAGAPPAVQQPAAQPAGPARDLAALNVCSRVPVADVAVAAGGRPLNEADFAGAACNYVVELPGDTEMYGIAVSEPATMQAMLDYMSAEEKGKAVEGLGGKAWLGTGPGADMAGDSSQPTLRILRSDMAIDVRGPRADVVLAVGRIAAERIQ